MRERRQTGADHIDIARGNAVRQGDQHGNGNDVGREEDADKRTRLGLGQMPLVDVGWQQRRQAEGANLHPAPGP